MNHTVKLDPVDREICGEYRGWNAHQRNGERQCDSCRKAAADYSRERRHQTGESKASLYTAEEIAEIRRTAVRESHRESLTRRASRIKYGMRFVA